MQQVYPQLIIPSVEHIERHDTRYHQWIRLPETIGEEAFCLLSWKYKDAVRSVNIDFSVNTDKHPSVAIEPRPDKYKATIASKYNKPRFFMITLFVYDNSDALEGHSNVLLVDHKDQI